MDKGANKKLKPTIKSSLIYTYVIKKKANGKVVGHKIGKMKEERGRNQPIWVPKEVITNMKGPQMVWVLKAMKTGMLGKMAFGSLVHVRPG
jgi:hypothetical protein